MFVAGESEIISKKHISSVERSGRLELFKRLMYLNNAYEFPILKSLYAAVLREIDLGYRHKRDDFIYIENTVSATSSRKFRPSADFPKVVPALQEQKISFGLCQISAK